MRCDQCQFEIPVAASFCPGCGKKLNPRCSHCATELVPEARFCHQCGAAADAAFTASPGAEQPARPAPPAAAVPRDESPPPVDAADQAERRHLTILFCDLVGSTALSERLDPEDLRHLVKEFHATASAIIERYDGFVSRYMGDGVLVLFGYPVAHDDDSIRAIRAAIEIVEAIDRLDREYTREIDYSIQVRIGISSGMVVAGDLIGKGAAEEKAVYGDAPNLAARLQGHARPGEVVISEATFKLTRNRFEVEDLGKHEFKGIAEPVRAYRVIGEHDLHRLPEADEHDTGIPLIGREIEMEMLLRCWDKAQDGESQVVLLSAEAGVGKSRMIQELKNACRNSAGRRAYLYCSPHHVNSAFYPVVEQIRYAAGIDKQDSDEQKIARLEDLAGNCGIAPADAIPLLSVLMNIPPGERYPPVNLSPLEQKRQTLEMLVNMVRGLSGSEPMLMIIEDVHWIDPSSQEFVHQLIERLKGEAFFLLLAYRIEYESPWASLPDALQLRLNRLGRAQCTDIVLSLTGGKPLPESVLEQILGKTDGVPLFVEEFTKTLLESSQLVEKADRFELEGDLSPLDIPATIQDSLAARLDRLEPAREVAQVGAAIGRVFNLDLLEHIVDKSEAEIASSLRSLVDAEVLIRRGIDPEIYFEFKHALIRDAAYQSLLQSNRKRHHRKIALAIRDRFPDIAAAQPEILAHHLTESDSFEEAIEYWFLAGNRAKQQSANVEAIAHFRHGIELIGRLPESAERDRRELEFYLALGPALMASRGFAVAEVEEVYERGLELGARVGSPTQLFTGTWGAWLFRQQRGQMGLATGLADQLLEISAPSSDDGVHLQAHHAAWTTAYRVAEFDRCCENAEQGTGLYDLQAHRDMAHVYGGHDAGICAFQHAAISRWILGFPEQAVVHKDRLLELVGNLSHPFSCSLAMHFASLLCHALDDPENVEALSSRGMETSKQYGVAPQYLNSGRIYYGWALYRKGRVDEGLERMLKGIEIHRQAAARAHEPSLMAIVAEACLQQELLEQAGGLIEDALAQIEQTGELCWQADLLRLRGELLLKTDPGGDSGEAALVEAIDLSRRQKALAFELRAATRLAGHWIQTGRNDDAGDLLRPVYDRFSEGLDTADLKRAAALLQAC